MEERHSIAIARQQALRAELKTWERLFAEKNGGRTAGKSDIKNNPDIAAKYKEYNKLRNPTAVSRPGSSHITPRKSRKSKNDASHDFAHPNSLHPAVIDPYDAPQSATATPRIVRTAIGPTPQKDGQILGLFDMLSPYTATPSKARTQPVQGPNMLQTPSGKRSAAQMSSSTPVTARQNSSGKRKRMDSSQTPSSLRHKTLTDLTPSASRLNKPVQPDPDQTPAFLKRFSEPVFASGDLGIDIAYTPPRIRLPRKPVGRTLSQLVQSLREQEDEQLDEEMALMREIETGEVAPPKLLVQDSQVGDLPLGADGEHEVSGDDVGGKESGPKRLWKKRGQKRTTRRANIGVSRAKWKPEAEWEAGGKDDEVTAETQAQNYNEDTDASDAENDGEEESGKKKPKKSKPAKDEKAKKTRKINPNAVSHANFRSLKIKNKNSKGKRGGRFGRR